MYKFILVLLLAFAGLAEAGPWRQMNTQCYFNRRVGECSAYNYSRRPIYCRGWTKGRTSYGYQGYMRNSGWLQPGQSLYIYVYANNPYRDPLVSTWGQIQCRY